MEGWFSEAVTSELHLEGQVSSSQVDERMMGVQAEGKACQEVRDGVLRDLRGLIGWAKLRESVSGSVQVCW